MSTKSAALIRRERMEITLPILIEYYLNTKKIKGCSPKTLLNTRSNLERFLRYLELPRLLSHLHAVAILRRLRVPPRMSTS